MAYWSHTSACKVSEVLWSAVYYVKILFQVVLRNDVWKQALFSNGSNSI